MLGSQDQGGALRRFFTLSGKEPFDSGRQGSCIFPALGLVEGEAKLKAVLLPGLAGGCLGGHAPPLVLQPGRVQSWRCGSLSPNLAPTAL